MNPRITWAAKTDIGRVRRENQDRWLARPGDGLFAIADGMGGMPGGADAATTALASLEEEFVRTEPGIPEAWEAVVRMVNEKVWQRGVAISPVEGIGTTLTLLHFEGQGARLVHVGDSACFLLRGGRLSQLTEDHTVAAEAARRTSRGLPVQVEPWAEHMLTRCIGQPRLSGADITAVAVEPGDRFLLCSDGVTKVLDDEGIAAALASGKTPDEAAAVIVDDVLVSGAPDNLTVITIFADPATA